MQTAMKEDVKNEGVVSPAELKQRVVKLLAYHTKTERNAGNENGARALETILNAVKAVPVENYIRM